MPVPSEDIANDTRPGAARRAAPVLIALLLALVAAAIASYVYNTSRQDIEQRQAAIAATGGNPDAAPAIVASYGCGGCHVIPGIAGATGQVGPDLTGLVQRVYVAGVITNTPDNLVRFIVDPRAIDPHSAMPTTGISAAEARDVAAYLYSIRR
jgi:cytochrome c2